MKLLINKQSVEEVVQVSVGYNAKDFENYIRESQEFDLKPMLCEDFYMSLLKESSPSLVVTGGVYQYNGKDYEFLGLKHVLSYFTYARFIMKSPIVSSTHGFRIKNNPNSDPAPFEERKNLYYKYREEAKTIFEGVKKYAERKNLEGWKCETENCSNFFYYKSNIIQ